MRKLQAVLGIVESVGVLSALAKEANRRTHNKMAPIETALRMQLEGKLANSK